MSITTPALSSPSLSFKNHVPFAKVAPLSHHRLRINHRVGSSRSLPTKIEVCNHQRIWDYVRISQKFPMSFVGRRLGLSVRASGNQEGHNDGISDAALDQAEKEARAQSTMPERFRYLTKEAPDPPVRWPWLVGESYYLPFL